MATTKEDFILFLRTTLASVEANDSAEGRIEYQWGKPGLYNVNAFVRVGNSNGQGGCIMLSDELQVDC